MPSLLDTIRKDAVAARKARAGTAASLVTLVGEIETRSKSRPAGQPLDDEEVLAVVRKFLKSNAETLAHARNAGLGDAVAKLEAERDAFEAYLPRQMTDTEIEDFVRGHIAAGATLGAVMAALKAERAGRYDGKAASAIAKRLLG